MVLGLAIGAAGAPALAVDDGGGAGDSAPPPPPPVDCRKQMAAKHDPHPEDWVYSQAQKKCVKKTAMDDRQLYTIGRDLALAGSYDSALEILGAVRDRRDAMVLTMLGYATRKLGRTGEGIALYHQALALDPDNVNTHEYLGEGYLAVGRIDLASAELSTLERLCGTTCSQYQRLQAAIGGAPVWN
jgi:tetratricopeptide (TPR) repeat protein